LPWLAVALGGAFGLTAFAEKLDAYSSIFMATCAVLLGYAGYRFWQKKTRQIANPTIELQSTITCPNCGFRKKETMPTDACQFFYECENCKSLLKPKPGDCCVYCSFGTVKCPPIQAGSSDCCK
jgi:hypothetical protein